MDNKYSRRKFLKNASLTTAGLSISGSVLSAKSYDRIIGANDRINFAVIGVRSRGGAHIDSISVCDNTIVSHLCDVDKRYLDNAAIKVKNKFGHDPVLEKDIRKIVESKDVDAITIASPEHWHAPMAIMGLQNGKHVYVEKPCSHNPAEGELLVEAQKKYKTIVQMGNQQRSAATTIEAIKQIRNGVIGKPYFGKAWYSNNRGPIGVGKEVPVPDYLDWELWQGPAPRRTYKDNVHPYNWHWFWDWGTGETLNNGTHEVDVCLWALDVKFPKRISVSGGRYHFEDDWEFYDTIITSYDYGDKQITWEGKSCNNMPYHKRGRGVTIHGTKGTVLIDRDGYEIYDNTGSKIFANFQKGDISMGLQGGGPMTDKHFQNFVDAIRNGKTLNSPIEEGNVSVTMLQLSNVAWKLDRDLKLNQKNGHILNDNAANKMWSREYEPGWELKI